jgi:predicted HTH transcriptional regulator
MNAKKLQSLIDLGENANVEFKQRFSDYEKIAKEMLAFANSSGGYIIVGINDDGKICGVKSEKGEANLLIDTAENYCEPQINYEIHHVELKKKEVVVFEVKESTRKPHRLQDYNNKIDLNSAQVFIRVNDKSVPASKEMIKILQARTEESNLNNYEITGKEKIVFDFLEEHETITVKQLEETANLSKRRASRTLIKMVRADLLNIHTKDNGEDFFTLV